MKSTNLALILSIFAIAVHGQSPSPPSTPTPSSFFDRKSPNDPLPGLVARTVIAGSGMPDRITPIVSVISSGLDYKQRVESLALSELRGTASLNGSPGFRAYGFIILEADAEVSFVMEATKAVVNGKDFGSGTYTQKLRKGRHPVQFLRAEWPKNQGRLEVTVAGQSVLFYSEALLRKELADSVKLDGKTMKSKLVGEVATPSR